MENFNPELLNGNNTEKEKEKEKKKIEWEKSRANVEGMVDKLGLGVDEGIKDFVATLRAMNISTTSSCEGHTGEDTAHIGLPYVRVFSRSKDKESESIQEALNENIRQARFIKSLLDEFYSTRQGVPEDVKISTWFFNKYGAFDVRNSKERLSESDKQNKSEEFIVRKIKEYQAEMNLFSSFLLDKFLNSK